MKEQRKQQKRSIVQWYEDEKRGLIKNMMLVWATILATTALFVVAYFGNLITIGAGAHSYSEQDYGTINEVIEGSRTEGIGMDIKNLRENLDECRTTSIGKKETVLEGILDRGYFKAIVEVLLNENYEIVETKRNYSSEEEYMVSFWKDFGVRILLCVLGIFIMLTGIFILGIKFIYTVALVLQRSTRKKERRGVKKNKKENSNTELEVSA